MDVNARILTPFYTYLTEEGLKGDVKAQNLLINIFASGQMLPELTNIICKNSSLSKKDSKIVEDTLNSATELTKKFRDNMSEDDFNFLINEVKTRAEQDDTDSQISLAGIYEKGLGPIQEDKENALRYIQLAADNKSAEALWLLGKYYETPPESRTQRS